MSDVSLTEAINNYKENDEIPEILEQFFVNIARTGYVPTTWDRMQTLFLSKLNKVVEEFYASNPFQPKQINKHCEQDKYEDMKQRLGELVLNFDEPPFTIQRLCELLTQPKKNYTKCDKFMRGFEKNLMVVSSWKKVSDHPHTLRLPKLSMNGLSPSKVDHTMIPSPVSTTPPRIAGGILFADSSENTSTGTPINEPEMPSPSESNKDDSTNEQVVSSSTDNENLPVKDDVKSVDSEIESAEVPARSILGKRKSECESGDERMDVDGHSEVLQSNPEVKKTKTDESVSTESVSPTKETNALKLNEENETKQQDSTTEETQKADELKESDDTKASDGDTKASDGDTKET